MSHSEPADAKPGGHAASEALVLVACGELLSAASYFEALGFRLDVIFPADAPRWFRMSGHGLHVQLQLHARRDSPPPATLLVPAQWLASAGDKPLSLASLTIEATPVAYIGLEIADPSAPSSGARFEFCAAPSEQDKGEAGRAGMHYRDLLPTRQGGAFIASHIRIDAGGPVPDYVHFHELSFQTIYCARGWVRVVYEDQGPAFVMHEGDCVLQPPRIRHRVLESSAGLEVVEISGPAEHWTRRDHDLVLPNGPANTDPARHWSGQSFVHHRAASASWTASELEGFESRDLEIARASGAVGSQCVLRRVPEGAAVCELPRARVFAFMYVLAGDAELVRASNAGQTRRALASGAAFAWGPDDRLSLRACSEDLALLWVRAPGK